MMASLAKGILGPPGHPSLPGAESICGRAVSPQVLWVPGHRADWVDGFLAFSAFMVW